MSLFETLLPLVVLGALCLALPVLLCPRNSLSQRRVAAGILGTAVLVFLAGGLIFALLYALQGKPVAQVTALHPAQSALYFARRSVLLVPAWAPILLLVWFGRAQRVEALRGLALAARQPDRLQEWDRPEE